MRLAWGAPVVIAVLATAGWTESVTLTPVRDTTLFEDLAGARSSGAGPYLFTGENNNQETRRVLLAFDPAAVVPALAHIERVTLYLYMSNSPDTTAATTLALHSMRTSWGEGTSSSTGGSGAPSTLDDATWVHRFYPDSLWAARGGDFEVVPVVAFGVRRLGPYSVSTSGMRQDVQRWLDRPELAFGWLMNGEEETAGSARRFDSREHPDYWHRPQLVIEYTVMPVTPTTWSNVKALFREE